MTQVTVINFPRAHWHGIKVARPIRERFDVMFFQLAESVFGSGHDCEVQAEREGASCRRWLRRQGLVVLVGCPVGSIDVRDCPAPDGAGQPLGESERQNLSVSLASGARFWGTSYHRHQRDLPLGMTTAARSRLSSGVPDSPASGGRYRSTQSRVAFDSSFTRMHRSPLWRAPPLYSHHRQHGETWGALAILYMIES